MARQRLVVVLLALIVLRPGARSSAQTPSPGYRMGVATALPKPVSSLDLARYGAMMSLTAEQMRAWGEMHERYKNDFKAMGEDGGAVMQFIEARKAADGVPFRAQPPREVIDKWMNAHQAVCAAIAALDTRLFDELTPLLTEGQQPLLQRARLSRERTRIAYDELVLEWLDPRTMADLCDVFAEFEKANGAALTAEQRTAAWATLDAHQAQYVAKLRGVQDAAQAMYREWVRLLAERGVPVNAVDLSKRDTMDREMFNKVSQAWGEVAAKVKPRLTAMGLDNRAKAKSITAMLPPESTDLFMRGYLKVAYPASPLEFFDGQAKALRRTLEWPDLSEAERAALQAQIADNQRTAVALSEQSADAEDLMSATRMPNRSLPAPPEVRQRSEEVRKAMNDEFVRQQHALTNLIGAERLNASYKASRDVRMRKMIRDSGVTDPEQIDDMLDELTRTGQLTLGQRSSPNSAMPDAISKAELQAMLAPLQLPPESLALVKQMHGDYARQYRSIFDDARNAINRLGLDGWMDRPDGKGGMTLGFAPPADVETAIALEAKTIASLRQLDAAFFNDAQTALGLDADALWRARLARDWATLARGERNGSAELRTYEAYAPLLAIIDGLALSPGEATKADAVIRARASEFCAAADAHFNAGRAAWYGRTMLTASTQRPTLPDDEATQAKNREVAALEATAGEKRAALAALIRSMLDEVIAALPARGEALLDGYERAAYPNVFDDPKGTSDALARALALKDLTDPQRTELQAAAAKYRPAWRDVCQRMIAVNREWDKERPYSSYQIPERDAAKFKWDQLLFERNELNVGIRATLQRVLTPEQRATIGMSAE